MRDHPVDVLIRLAYLEGVIRTRGAYETAVARRESAIGLSPGRDRRLEDLLCAALPAGEEAAEAWSIGTWLRAFRRSGSLRPMEICRRLGISPSLYRRIEQDEISPPDLSPELWRRFREEFRLSLDTLERLLRGTHRLVIFRPTFRSALARRKGGRGEGARSGEMGEAVREMFARADLEIPAAEERRMEDFLRELR